ncbi:MAG: hypothetical protein AB7P40_19905 [Chloroflexota bacterium]
MEASDETLAALMGKADVGDTIRVRIEKAKVSAEVRDRISPVLEPPATPGGQATLVGFTKDASGFWDLEGLTGGKGSTIVEVVIRRAASEL